MIRLASLYVLFGAAAVFGQSPAAPSRPVFDVISIKPTEGTPRNSGYRRASPGALNATNVTVRMLIEYAYDVRDDQISGGPGWLDSDRYEVMAKPPEGPESANNNASAKLRTQSLLADRFHLVLRHEMKEMPVLVLTVARNGPKGLKPSTGAGSPDYVTNGRHLNCQHVSMAVFGEFLARQTQRSVTDKTGIAGDFDFTLDWTPDEAANAVPASPAEAEAAAPRFPPFFLALQEQLGLRLEQQKGPVDVLIVQSAERPAAN